MAWRCVRCIRSIRCVRWSSKQVSTERNRCPPGEVGVHWAHFYWKIAPGGHLKIPLGTKIRENRGRWRPFHMSTGRGIKSCPPDMIRAIFASGDTMNVLPAAVFLDECVRRAICGIKFYPPGMIRADFRVRKAFCARRRPNNCSPVTMILSHTPVSVLFSPLFRKQRFVIAEYRS